MNLDTCFASSFYFLNEHWRIGVFRYVNGVGMSPRALCHPGGGAQCIWPHPSSSGRSSSSEILHLRWDQRDMVEVARSGQAIFVLCFLERGPSAMGTTQWQHSAGEGPGLSPLDTWGKSVPKCQESVSSLGKRTARSSLFCKMTVG